MFDIGFAELLVVAVLGLLVLGPERLPQAIRTGALWIGRFKRSFNNVRTEIEREIGADEIRRQLHNEAIMADLKKTQDKVNRGLAATQRPLDLSDLERVAADARPVIEDELPASATAAEQLDIARPEPESEPEAEQAVEQTNALAESVAEQPEPPLPEVNDDSEADAEQESPAQAPAKAVPGAQADSSARKPIKVTESPYQARRP